MPGAASGHGSRRHPLSPLAAPFIQLCLLLRLPPTFLTLLSLPLAGIALVLLVQGRILLALPFVFAAAGADAVDGAVARALGATSRTGAYLDSLTDRIVDLMVLLGVMIAIGEMAGWIAGTLALFGTLTTSAAKWRLLQERPDAKSPRGFDRTERYVVILAGLIVAGILGTPWQATALFGLLVVLAVATNLSVLFVVWRSLRLLRSDIHHAEETPGQQSGIESTHEGVR